MNVLALGAVHDGSRLLDVLVVVVLASPVFLAAVRDARRDRKGARR